MASPTSAIPQEMSHFVITSRHLVLTGLLAIAAGACGLLTYIGLFVLPPVVPCCAFVILLGISMLLQSELRVDDPVFLGFSFADVMTAVIKNYKESWSSFVMLCCLPDLAAEDVALVYRRRFMGASYESREATGGAAASTGVDVLPHRVNNGTSPCNDLMRNSSGPIDEFDAAVRWLRRPCLSIRLREQLHLHSLYLQATIGDAGVETVSNSPASSVAAFGSLARLKLEGWQSVRGLSQAAARSQLPSALAKVDRSFAVAHPRLAPPPAAEPLVLLQLIERRLPTDLDERVARVQRYLFGSSLMVSVLALLSALRAALRSATLRNPRRLGPRPWLAPAISMGIAVPVNMYLGALACGLPAWLQALLLRRVYRGGREVVSARLPSDAAGRLRSLLLRVVLPRLMRPLLAD